MSQRFPEQIETELIDKMFDAIDSDMEFEITSNLCDQLESKPGVPLNERDRQLVFMECRPKTEGSLSIDPISVARLIGMATPLFFHKDGETFLRVVGFYDGFFVMIDVFPTPNAE